MAGCSAFSSNQLVRATRNLLALAEGLRPSDSPTRSLARRFAGALRSRGSLATARSLTLVSGVAVYEIRSSLEILDQLFDRRKPCLQRCSPTLYGCFFQDAWR